MITAAAWRDGSNPARLAMSLDVGGWAWVLSRPGNTFPLSHSYDLMSVWASEDVWALLFVIGAIALLGASLITSRWLRVVAAVYGCGLQTAIAVSFGAAPALNTGFMTHVGLALLGPWLVWRELEP